MIFPARARGYPRWLWVAHSAGEADRCHFGSEFCYRCESTGIWAEIGGNVLCRLGLAFQLWNFRSRFCIHQPGERI